MVTAMCQEVADDVLAILARIQPNYCELQALVPVLDSRAVVKQAVAVVMKNWLYSITTLGARSGPGAGSTSREASAPSQPPGKIPPAAA